MITSDIPAEQFIGMSGNRFQVGGSLRVDGLALGFYLLQMSDAAGTFR